MTMPAARRHTCRAFSLLEHVIALAIVAVGLLSTARLFGDALTQLQANAEQRAATLLAEELLDLLIAARADVAAIAGPGSAGCAIALEPCFEDAGTEARLRQWRRRVDQRLPDARATLSATAPAATTEYQLEMHWSGRRPHTQRFSVMLSNP